MQMSFSTWLKNILTPWLEREFAEPVKLVDLLRETAPERDKDSGLGTLLFMWALVLILLAAPFIGTAHLIDRFAVSGTWETGDWIWVTFEVAALALAVAYMAVKARMQLRA